MNLSVVKKQSALFLLLFFFFFSACTKIVTTDIGSGLIPPIDGVNTKEMYLDVVSKNIKDTITRVGTADDHALGYVTDPLFGQTTASINVELKPSSFPFSFPVSSAKDSLMADSVVLVLSYRGIWGDSLTPLSFRVFQIPSDGGVNLRHDSVYETNYPAARSGELTENNIFKTVFPATLNDSVKPYPFMEAAVNQLRIRLNKEYCQDLLNLSTNTYSSDSLFDSIGPKSYAIVPVSGNSLLRINLLDTNTKLAIYFRYKDRVTQDKIDTAVRYFRCNQYTCGSTNFITRNRTNAQAELWLPPKNTDSNDSLIFIDGNPGIYAKLQIPGLESLSNRVIHRAEILMEQVADPGNGEEKYLAPPNIFLAPFSQDSSRKFALPNDIQFGSGFVSNQSSLGCYPSKKTDSATGQSIYAYSFDISRYVQGIITRHEKSYPLILYAPSVRDFIYVSETSLVSVFTGAIGSDGAYIPLNAPAFGRVRLGGGGNSIHKMRLHIVYSDL